MNKEIILVGIICLVVGSVGGFMFANSINRGTINAGQTTASTMEPNANVPPGHPDISGGGGGSPTAAQMEEMPQVKAALEKAKNEPDNYDAQLAAAGVNYQIGKYDAAIEILNKAIKLKPDEVEPKVMLGNAYFDTEKYEDAEKWYVDALAKTPNDIAVRTDLGLTFVLRTSPNYDRAIQEFNKSLAIDPNHLQTLQNLTVAYTKKGDATNAKATLAKVEKIDPQNSALTKLKEEVSKLGN